MFTTSDVTDDRLIALPVASYLDRLIDSPLQMTTNRYISRLLSTLARIQLKAFRRTARVV